MQAIRKNEAAGPICRKKLNQGTQKNSYCVHTNPNKSAQVMYTPDDKAIVLAEG